MLKQIVARHRDADAVLTAWLDLGAKGEEEHGNDETNIMEWNDVNGCLMDV